MPSETSSKAKSGKRWAYGGMCLIVLGALGWSVSGMIAKPDVVLHLQINTARGPTTLQTDVFLPANSLEKTSTENSPRCPAIILLHGVEGADRYAGTYAHVARRLNAHGYAVYFVHYFDAVPYADLWHLDTAGNLDLPLIHQACVNDAAYWTSAVVQAASQIAARPEVDAQCMAIEGFSLGGYVALDTAAQLAAQPQSPRITAVVNNWGAIFEHTQIPASFPPVLFVHGEHDQVVPLAAAQQAQKQIHAAGRSVQLCIIPGGGHTDTSPNSDQTTFDFLAQHLTACQHGSLNSLPFSYLATSQDNDIWQLAR